MKPSANLFRTRLERLLLAALFCGLTGAGLALWRVEAAALAEQTGIAPQLRLLASAAPLAPGFGQRSVEQALAACFSGLDAITEFYPLDARHQAADVCRQTAELILRDAPTNGAARQLLAEAYFRLGLSDAALSALADASATAPNTTWLIQRRVLLLSRFAPGQRGAPMPDAAPLVAKLIRVPQSREWLARAYVRDPAMRALLKASAAALPAPQAAQFLARVKALSAAAQRTE